MKKSSRYSVAKPLVVFATLVVGASPTFAADAPRILLHNSPCVGSQEHFPGALNNLGHAFTETDTQSALAQALANDGPWDLVIVDEYSDFIDSAAGALAAHVDSGGKAYMNYWNWTPTLASIFDATVSASYSAPVAINDWDSAHTLFNSPGAVSTPLTPDRDTCFTDGARFGLESGGVAVGGYSGSPSANQAGIIVGNDGRTVLFGGILGLFDEGAAFAENVVAFLVGGGTSQLSVEDAQAAETDTTAAVDFVVQLSASSDSGVTLSYHTEDGTAVDGEDYQGTQSGSLTIPAGQTSGMISVPVFGDSLHEGDETFLVIIDSVSGAELADDDDQAEGTIVNDDAAPTVSIALSATRVYEDPDRRRPSSTITATLSEVSGLDTVIDFALSGTATVDVDYTLPALVVPAGQTQASVHLTVIEDEINERVETATLSYAGSDYEVEIHSKRARSGRRGR